MPQLYLILGARGSGRREVLLDLLKYGLDPSEQRALVLLAKTEPQADIDAQFETLSHVAVDRWSDADGIAQLPEFPEATTDVFLIADGGRDPVDQLELLRDYCAEREDVELARIITVLHSHLLFQKPDLQPWFDACIHFSDVVLFNRREEVPNKWFRDFEQRFKKECYPCLFDIVKGGRVRNPAEVLYPEPRRLSLAFDPEAQENDWADEAEFIDEIVDEDDVAIDAHDDSDEDDDETIPEEPYFARDMTGRRVRRLPSIAEHLDQ